MTAGSCLSYIEFHTHAQWYCSFFFKTPECLQHKIPLVIDTWYCTKQRDRKAFSDIFKGKNIKTTWFKPCPDQMHGTVSLKTKYSSNLRINVNLKALSNNQELFILMILKIYESVCPSLSKFRFFPMISAVILTFYQHL